MGLDQLLAESDIITLHVPLTRDGVDATVGLVDAAFLAKVRPRCIFINAARGAVVRTDDLLSAMREQRVAHAGAPIGGGNRSGSTP